jgi:2-oxoglutarate dehydrogenase E1 component
MERFDFSKQGNADYIEQLYEQYQRDPDSLDDTWRAYFAGFEFAGGRGFDRTTPAEVGAAGEASALQPLTIGVHKLVHSFRELGHFIAQLDPLGHNRQTHPLLELSQFSMTEADMGRQVGKGGFLGATDGTLRDLLAKLRQTYCGTIGVEYQTISDMEQRDWLAKRIEPTLNKPGFTADQSRAILFQLVAAEEFEKFLITRYTRPKKFGLEGAEALIPLMNTLVDDGADLGVEEMCIGMSHRGRLNVLAHVLNKPYEVICSEFKGTIIHEESEGDGDVKYHLGYANDRPSSKGRMIHIGLSPNPSHLELIDPVVEGIVRAKQKARGDKDHSRVVPVLLHGDAAFTGQGIVHETLGLSELPFFRTGGTIHVIVNNQIGFTTTPGEGRFTPYATDVAKMIQAPIFHVNGDDPEAVVHAAKLAIAFRQQFKCDVFLDLICYRRFGHNEQDEPGFTQPVMYKEIATHKSVRELYAEQLVGEGKLTQPVLDEMARIAKARLNCAGDLAEEKRPRQRTASMNNLWKGMIRQPNDWTAKTGVPAQVLLKIAEGVNRLPPDFTPHPKITRLMGQRLETVNNGKGIDWGCGEMLALGSLLLEGSPVRFTGQDVQRGTFSHRHAVFYDYNTNQPYTPLNFLVGSPTAFASFGTAPRLTAPPTPGNSVPAPGRPIVDPDGKPLPRQAHLTIVNTMLSELAVVGFEYGFSSGDPRNLVVWEAQFGDFVNGAQPVIDQFIAASESKWQLMNGLVMFLPHGFEGQGPEHSNAYVDRFLSMCAENNLQIVIPSVPSQVFHALRRQLHRKFRKPLVMMMPKSLLRHAPSFSQISEFTEGTGMQLVIDDPISSLAANREKVRRVLFCTGKVYYTLSAEREKEKISDVAIVRVEQLYPYPKKEIQAALGRYRLAREVVWVQEEPRNRGAWHFMEDRLRELLPDPLVLSYVGREEAASPATGSNDMHKKEEQELVVHALDIKPKTPPEPPVAKSGAVQAVATPEPAAAATPDGGSALRG